MYEYISPNVGWDGGGWGPKCIFWPPDPHPAMVGDLRTRRSECIIYISDGHHPIHLQQVGIHHVRPKRWLLYFKWRIVASFLYVKWRIVAIFLGVLIVWLKEQKRKAIMKRVEKKRHLAKTITWRLESAGAGADPHSHGSRLPRLLSYWRPRAAHGTQE